jgi:adenylosuccinate synthase
MPLDIVVGTQWGDEGKGRIVDLLAAEAQIVARYSGGDNAGHTITAQGRLLRLHLIPSGILHPGALCALGAGMVINPAALIAEMDELESRGLPAPPERLKISTAAHILTPAHLALDGAEEAGRGSGELGTTRRGIGPGYADKAARRGIRAGSMHDPEAFGLLVEEHVRAAGKVLDRVYGLPGPDPRQAGAAYAAYAERLRPHLADVGAVVAEALERGQNVLAEGAQGTLLDLDHGTYPFVTSSHPTAPGALISLGVGGRHVRRVIGVTKAFQTRVGAGPFPTELAGAEAERLRGSGANPWDEFGTTTGRPRRCGWLDGVLLRYAARLNGLTELALTKLDILSGLHPLRLCRAYQAEGRELFDPPGDAADLGRCSPLYEELPGWDGTIGDSRMWRDLPSGARDYVQKVEGIANLPVRSISVGPGREQVILRGESA